MNFLTLVGKEMRMLSRSLVFYLLIAVALLFFYGNYATSESWSEGMTPIPPQEQADQAGTAAGKQAGQTTAPTEKQVGHQTAAPIGKQADRAGEALPGTPSGVQNVPMEFASVESAPPPMPAYGYKEVTDPGLIAQRYQTEIEANLKNGWMEQRIFFGAFGHKAKLTGKDRRAMQAAADRFRQIAQDPAGHTAAEVKKIAADLDKKLGGWTNYMRDGIKFMDEIKTYDEAMGQYRAKAAEYRQRVEEGRSGLLNFGSRRLRACGSAVIPHLALSADESDKAAGFVGSQLSSVNRELKFLDDRFVGQLQAFDEFLHLWVQRTAGLIRPSHQVIEGYAKIIGQLGQNIQIGLAPVILIVG